MLDEPPTCPAPSSSSTGTSTAGDRCLGHAPCPQGISQPGEAADSVATLMGSLIKKRRKRMRKKKHKKMLKRTRWQRRAAGK